MNNKYLIEGFQAYPVYEFMFEWTKDVCGFPYTLPQGLPNGSVSNGTQFRKMFKIEKSQKWLDDYAAKRWQKYAYKNNVNILTKISAKFLEYETWVLTWFQHETFDVGQTDEETLKSFENFVSRKEKLNKQYGENYCLMGAEDRYRWHGIDKDKYTSAPCRCKYCKKQHVLRIAH